MKKDEENMPYNRINISLPTDVKEKLEKICEEEHRSQSNMISYLILQYSKKVEK